MDPSFALLDEINGKITELTGVVESTYLLISDFSLPEFIEVSNVSSLIIPELPDLSSALSMNDEILLRSISDYKLSFLNSRLSAAVDARVKRVDDLVLKTNELQRIKNARSWMKVSFSPFEPYYNEWTTIDKVLIDGKEVSFTMTSENGKITYYVQSIQPMKYELRLKKEGYIDVVFDLKTQIAESIDLVDELSLGNINMLSVHQQLKFIFTWGEYPLDLDTHVYSFSEDLKNVEHMFFLKMKTDESKIDLDVDDVTSYGPETTHIFNLDTKKYYLLTIHNYSRYIVRDETTADMDPDKLVNVKVQLYDFDLNIKPEVDLKEKYWWDVLLIHDGKIYVLNSTTDDRSIGYYHLLSSIEKKQILRMMRDAEEVYDISRYKPTSLRWT